MRNSKSSNDWKLQIASVGTRWLTKQQKNPVAVFARFTRGSMLFAMGLVIIMFADKLLVSSLQQELMALMGVFLVAIGGLLAFFSFTAITLAKLLIYILPEPKPDNSTVPSVKPKSKSSQLNSESHQDDK